MLCLFPLLLCLEEEKEAGDDAHVDGVAQDTGDGTPSSGDPFDGFLFPSERFC